MINTENAIEELPMVKPIIVRGTCNEAYVYARALEMNCEDQLLQYLNHEAFRNTTVRVMPDVHLGKGTVVGFTAGCNDYVVPSLIGVDIGCGVSAYNLGQGKQPFEKLDRFIRREIPSGTGIHSGMHPDLESSFAAMTGKIPSFPEYKKSIRDISERTGQDIRRVLAALGSLGGGNHFIEVDVDEMKNRWLIVHSGSRHFGLRVARYHEAAAAAGKDQQSCIQFLGGDKAAAYLEDMSAAQLYARHNRMLMVSVIVEHFFKEDFKTENYLESIHNYIDFNDRIVRKGAVAAHRDQKLIIPFSMSEGAVIAIGKGNPEWNFSAPHGSGRKTSRGEAFRGLSMDEYRKQMKGVWSTSVNEKTLDESPMAYKRKKEICAFLGETVDIIHHLDPVYNFKSPGE